MKNIILFPIFAFILFSCNDAHKVAPEDSLSGPDTAATPEATSTSQIGEKPQPVRNGKAADYAYYPDTSLYDLVLGNAASFKTFTVNNGYRSYQVKNSSRGIALYYAYKKGEWMLVQTTKNAVGEDVAYSCTVQKVEKGSPPPPPAKSIEFDKQHVMTGHNIYIGMTPEYVLAIYRDQELMEWQKGDTLYMQYKPKAKDAPFCKRFKFSSYTATYKFVDDRLRRIEYYVDPADLEARK